MSRATQHSVPHVRNVETRKTRILVPRPQHNVLTPSFLECDWMKTARHLYPRTMVQRAYGGRHERERRELHRSAINYGRTRHRRQPDRQ